MNQYGIIGDIKNMLSLGVILPDGSIDQDRFDQVAYELEHKDLEAFTNAYDRVYNYKEAIGAFNFMDIINPIAGAVTSIFGGGSSQPTQCPPCPQTVQRDYTLYYLVAGAAGLGIGLLLFGKKKR